MELEAHAGPVTCAQFSPHVRKLVLTGGFAGVLHLSDSTAKTPLLSLCPPTGADVACSPISAVEWSPSRAAVFAAGCSNSGHVFLYDLSHSQTEPQVVSLGRECRGVSALAFNGKQRGLLAVGDVSGCVHVIRLPHSLATPHKGDREENFLPQLL